MTNSTWRERHAYALIFWRRRRENGESLWQSVRRYVWRVLP